MASVKSCMLAICLWGLVLSQKRVQGCPFAGRGARRGVSEHGSGVDGEIGRAGPQRKLLQVNAACPVFKGTYTEQLRTLYRTGTYLTVTATKGSCLERCTADCTCVGFTFRRGFFSQSGTCLLKNALGGQQKRGVSSFTSTFVRDRFECPLMDPLPWRPRAVPAQIVSVGTRSCWIAKIKEKMTQLDTQRARLGETRIAADLLRLVFHDCGIGHCDASVILYPPEFADFHNRNLEGGQLIQQMKNHASFRCSQTISWADTIVLSAAIGVTRAGGPMMEDTIKLGRADRAGPDTDTNRLPLPSMDTPALVQSFATILGVTLEEAIKHTVTLSGGHTIGDATCDTFTERRTAGIPSGKISARIQRKMGVECPFDCLKADFDISTPNIFDNKYFVNLRNSEGLLFSDQVLYTNNFTEGMSSTANFIDLFAESNEAFFASWRDSFTALTNL